MPFRVKGIALGKYNNQPSVLLEDTDGRNLLSFTIGPSEARAILVELEGLTGDEPGTHDLVAELFRSHRFRLKHVEIDDFSAGGHAARLCYRKGLRTHWLNVRAGDAIAVAVRMKAPIFVNPDLVFDAEGRDDSEASLDVLFFDRERLQSHLA